MECDHLDHYSPDRGLLGVRYILGIDEQEAQQHGSNDTPEQKELLQLPSEWRSIVFLTAILLMSPLILGLTYTRKKELELQELIRQRKERETWRKRS